MSVDRVHVVLDPGHGGDAFVDGASPIGARGPMGGEERWVTLDLAHRLARALERRGIAASCTRTVDESVGLGERTARVRAAGATHLVSLHLNQSDDPRERGSEAWAHSAAGPRSEAFGAALLEAVTRVLAEPTRGVRRDAFGVLDPDALGDEVAATLVELGFLSCPDTERVLSSEGTRDSLARAMADAIARFAARTVVRHTSMRWCDVWHEVPLIAQRSGMSCWAAAAAMVVAWRDCLDVDPEEIARGSGRWAEYRDGLLPDDVETLARAFRLVIEAPRTYAASDLRAMLERSGPLWMGEASPGLHVVVVTGMEGDDTPEGTRVRICDPWPDGRGERYVRTFRELLDSFHEVERVSGIRARILHCGDGAPADRGLVQSLAP